MNKQHIALVEVIDAFKSDDISTLEGALNVIANHAETIKQQHVEIERLKSVIAEAAALLETEEA